MNALLLGMMLGDLKAEARQAGEVMRALRKRVVELEGAATPRAVTDRLPVPERPVLGWVPAYDGWAVVAWWPNNSGPGEWYHYFSFGDDSVRQFTSVSHWLPLPERPA